MRNARTVIAGVLCALMICCMLGNAYTVKGKEMLLAPENKETKDQNTENSKIEDNNTENEEELNKGAKKEDTSMQIGAPSALLMEASTGTILYEKNSHTVLRPASITKIMTLILIFDAIESGQISLEDTVTVSEYAASMGGSQVFLEPNETQTVDTMIKCISIASANDAGVAMAEFICGSEAAFVEKMNERAKGLGMNNTTFINCCGLDTDGHMSTARDVALMSRELIVQYPQIHNYSTIWMDTITHVTRKGESEFGLTNTNKLIKQYQWATGLKTGSTGLAKCCLSATANKDGVELIAVIMAAPDSKTRFSDAVTLLNYGYSVCDIYHDTEMPQLPNLSVSGGRCDTLSLSYAKEFSTLFLEPVDTASIEKQLTLPETVTAPVNEGDVIGTLTYTLDGKTIGTVDITAAQSVSSATYGDALFKMFRKLTGAA